MDAKLQRGLVSGLQGIAIYVKDLEQAKEFYTGVLGFEFKSEVPGGIFLAAGDTTVYVEGGRKKRLNPGLTSTCVSPAFAVSSVKQAFETLKGQGLVFIQEYVEYAPTFAMFRIADLDGNVLEFAGQP